MLNFLFWNIAKRPLTDHIVRLAASRNVDVLMLAESTLKPADLLAKLNEQNDAPFDFPESDGSKIQFYARSRIGRVVEQFVDPPGSITIRRIDLPNARSVLVAVLHLPSKLNWSVVTQAQNSVAVAGQIALVEQDVGHSRTIVVGDFNMNPFDAGLTSALGFNAVVTRREARIRPRTFHGRSAAFFFNPMWSLFGDRGPRPAGTFYHRSPTDGQAWNLYDQVIVRPSLMHGLSAVEIIQSDGVEPLTTRHGTLLRRASDHLPIFFSLDPQESLHG